MNSSESLLILQQIESKLLFEKLIEQIKKDANFSGVEFQCEKDCSEEQLIRNLYGLLLHLIVNDFGTYLNFLYRVDLSESTLKQIDEEDPEKIAQRVTFLIIKREWQKVFFRNKNQ